MVLHLIKLCVGIGTVEELQAWVDFRLAERREQAKSVEYFHTTRMTPKRSDELLSGGSLYWVIKGNIQCRQKLREIRRITDREGVGRCRLVLEPEVVPTLWQPRRAFQGWRYLLSGEAPTDLDDTGMEELPAELQQELAELGLL